MRSNAAGGSPSLRETRITTATRNWMTTPNSHAATFHIASLDALRLRSGQVSACSPAPQATPSLGRGVSACGTIHSGCRLASEGIRFDSLPCRMQSGSSARQKKIIYRSKKILVLSGVRSVSCDERRRRMLRLRASLQTLSPPLSAEWQMDSWRKHFVHQNFIHC